MRKAGDALYPQSGALPDFECESSSFIGPCVHSQALDLLRRASISEIKHKVIVRKAGDALYFLPLNTSLGSGQGATIGPSRPFPDIRAATAHCPLGGLIHSTRSHIVYP